MTHKRHLFLAVLFLLLFPMVAHARQEGFAIISDTHVGAPNSAYASVIKTMEDRGVELIIHCGDAINSPGDAEQWGTFLGITGPDKLLHLAPGNHDIRGWESLPVYRSFFPSLYHSFSEDDTLFVLLNTEIPGEESMVTGDQLAWLASELKRPFRFKFVFLHKSLYPVTPFHGLDRHRGARDLLHRLFVENGVSLVVAGHDHMYKRGVREGVTYVVTGATGGRLPPFTRDGSAFRYIIATRTGDEYAFAALDMEGGQRDLFTVGPGQSKAHPGENDDTDRSLKQGEQVENGLAKSNIDKGR